MVAAALIKKDAGSPADLAGAPHRGQHGSRRVAAPALARSHPFANGSARVYDRGPDQDLVGYYLVACCRRC
jgi:hypothetical protein